MGAVFPLRRADGMPVTEPRSFWTELDGLRVHGFRAGAPGGVPIVLVHGLGVSSRYFHPLARVLARDFPVLAVDLPGTGKSDPPREALDIPSAGRLLARWLRAQGHDRACFVANSLGGEVVVDLAWRDPGIVTELVLLGPTLEPSRRSIAKQVPRWLLESTREPLRLLPILVADYARMGPVRFLKTGRHALRYAIEKILPEVAAPTLVIRGENDGFVSHAWARRMATLLPRGSFAEVKNAAHAVHFAQPEHVGALVRDFLRHRA